MIHELSVPLPVITPKGKGLAYFLLDYSIDHHLFWVCFQDDTGECWTFSNPEIRIQNNPTIGRNVAPPSKAALHGKEKDATPKEEDYSEPFLS